MKITETRFIKSSDSLAGCPPARYPEYAFLGRSNVGKSSLINMLCNKKKLARTSAEPGKTRVINHYLINETWYLVDLPGYGYARTSKKNREKFAKNIRDYILYRGSLVNLFLLVDARLRPQEPDLEFIHFLGEERVPFSMVFTKTDKISVNKVQGNLAVYKKELLKSWEVLPGIFLSSTITKTGREEILDYIESTLNSINV